jgi:hypothetical protein
MNLTELYVILERANPDETITVIDPNTRQEYPRNGLHKILTGPVLKGNLEDLYSAMVDINPDEINPGYNPAEQTIANTYLSLKNTATGNKILLNPRLNGKINKDITYSLTDKIETCVPAILEPISCIYNGRKIQTKSIDLVVSVSNTGGNTYE